MKDAEAVAAAIAHCHDKDASTHIVNLLVKLSAEHDELLQFGGRVAI